MNIYTCLCLLFLKALRFSSRHYVSPEFPTRFCAAVKRCSSEVLKLSFPKRLYSEVLIRSEVVGVAKVANN